MKFKNIVTTNFAIVASLLCFSSAGVSAQNLVVNNGFEDTVVSNPKSYLRFVPGQSVGG